MYTTATLAYTCVPTVTESCSAMLSHRAPLQMVSRLDHTGTTALLFRSHILSMVAKLCVGTKYARLNSQVRLLFVTER